jgi:hypothetical protein
MAIIDQSRAQAEMAKSNRGIWPCVRPAACMQSSTALLRASLIMYRHNKAHLHWHTKGLVLRELNPSDICICSTSCCPARRAHWPHRQF